MGPSLPFSFFFKSELLLTLLYILVILAVFIRFFFLPLLQ